MELIDKAKVVEEIAGLKERYALCPTRNNYEEGLKEGRLIGYKDALDKINSIEAKEVDLEKEIKEEYLKRRCYVGKDNMLVILNDPQFNEVAKHFFELSLRCKSSYVSIPNIDDTLEEMGVDSNSKLAKNFKESYYMALENFKEKKGE